MIPDASAPEPPRSPIRVFVFVTRGEAANVSLVFEPGRRVEPFSVGSQGGWRIGGNAVAPVHFFLGFDGESLVGAAPGGTAPVLVSGEPLGSAIKKLPAVCEITFGDAAIAVTSAGTNVSNPGPARPRRSDPRGPRITDPFARDTIVESMPSPVTDSHLDDLLPTRTYRIQERGTPQPSAPEAPTLSIVPPAVVALGWAERARTVSAWTEPGVESAMAATLVMPVTTPAMVLAASASKEEEGGTAKHPARAGCFVKGARRAAVLSVVLAVLSISAVIAIAARTFAKRSAGEAVTSNGPTRISPAASVSVTRAPPTPAPSERAEPTSPGHDDTPLRTIGGKTPERQAVDLVARGAYAEAAAFYERLARQSSNPAFRDAARIARRKERGR